MRTRLLLLFAFAAATVLMNVASAGNIAHGVEVVVIDAGHGGKFPGAHYGGVYEKDLTLKVALKLGKLVEEGMPGVKVVYTRTADRALGGTWRPTCRRGPTLPTRPGATSSSRSTPTPHPGRRACGASRR